MGNCSAPWNCCARNARLQGNEHEKVMFDCRGFRAMRLEELRMAAQVAADKVRGPERRISSLLCRRVKGASFISRSEIRKTCARRVKGKDGRVSRLTAGLQGCRAASNVAPPLALLDADFEPVGRNSNRNFCLASRPDSRFALLTLQLLVRHLTEIFLRVWNRAAAKKSAWKFSTCRNFLC